MKLKRQFWLFTTIIVAILCGFLNCKQVNAQSTSRQLRSYTKKIMRKNHLRGTIEIVQNGHRQQVSEGYGYYRRRINNGSKKLVYPVGSLQKSITAAIIKQSTHKTNF